MNDREIAYEQNVTGLEAAWAERIESFAGAAVRQAKPNHPDPDHSRGYDPEGLRLEASEIVTARLLDSERWANVKATDISDIAYEAVCRVLDAEYDAGL